MKRCVFAFAYESVTLYLELHVTYKCQIFGICITEMS